MLVKDTVAEQLEKPQSDLAYSRPVVVLDLLWNLAFVVAAAAAVLVSNKDEDPSMPLRLWIMGYALQCLLHMLCVYVEYRCRYHQVQGELMEDGSGRSSSLSSQQDVEEDGVYDAEHTQDKKAQHCLPSQITFSLL
ncbi:hypothetical protein MRB53_010066 [Persea americana]|uniref:Uncharacterized protein n=1 Tax=Persea americana TaxID=3435 RepID=A0ACC2LQS3_PERAE|nr:hypothetical protein MRB53_010066 [Persea americana]